MIQRWVGVSMVVAVIGQLTNAFLSLDTMEQQLTFIDTYSWAKYVLGLTSICQLMCIVLGILLVKRVGNAWTGISSLIILVALVLLYVYPFADMSREDFQAFMSISGAFPLPLAWFFNVLLFVSLFIAPFAVCSEEARNDTT